MAGGLREEKKARTRAALADAAARLFAERGYAGTTVEDIAAAAGVSPRTFFRYFAAKEDVVLVDLDLAFDHWEAAFTDGPPDEPLVDAIRRATHAVNADFLARRSYFELLQRLMRDEPALALRALAFDQAAVERAAVLIADALDVDAGADPRPRTVAAVAMAAVRVATASWAAAGGTGDRGAAIDGAYDELLALGDTLRLPRGSSQSRGRAEGGGAPTAER